MDFTASSPAHATMLTGPAPNAYNTLQTKDVVVPKNVTFSVKNGREIHESFPAYSVTVMTMNIRKW
jgi:alpha-L-arabinofuranosidase